MKATLIVFFLNFLSRYIAIWLHIYSIIFHIKQHLGASILLHVWFSNNCLSDTNNHLLGDHNIVMLFPFVYRSKNIFTNL